MQLLQCSIELNTAQSGLKRLRMVERQRKREPLFSGAAVADATSQLEARTRDRRHAPSPSFFEIPDLAGEGQEAEAGDGRRAAQEQAEDLCTLQSAATVQPPPLQGSTSSSCRTRSWPDQCISDADERSHSSMNQPCINKSKCPSPQALAMCKSQDDGD